MSRLRLIDRNDLKGEFERLSEVDLERVLVNNMGEIYNRGKQTYTKADFGPGVGTPVDTGELRESLGQSEDGLTVGYTKEYAPHVEFGHRTVNGGWVPGQRFLQNNVEIQKPILMKDLQNALKGK